MSKKIAISIETRTWYSIIEQLKASGWKVVTEYDQFDKGIDFDLYELKKGSEKVLFVWDNWFEGEMKCSKDRILKIEEDMNVNFEFGESKHF